MINTRSSFIRSSDRALAATDNWIYEANKRNLLLNCTFRTETKRYAIVSSSIKFRDLSFAS